jgi:hypothetical protein
MNDSAFVARYSEVALVCRYEYRVRGFQRHRMIVGSEKMLFQLGRQFYTSAQNQRVVRYRELEAAQHRDVIGSRFSALL